MDICKTGKSVETVLFDLDGTIFKRDLATRLTESLNLYNIMVEGGYFSCSYDDFRKKLKLFWAAAANKGFSESKIVTQECISTIFHNIFMLEPGKIQAHVLLDLLYEADGTSTMDGVQEVLEELYNSGLKMIAVTNWFKKYQVKRLKQLDLLKYFEQVFGWDDAHAKPHKLACGYYKHANANFEGCIMIGDSITSDIGYANNLGIASILVQFKDLDRDLLNKYKPTYHVTDMGMVLDIITML